MDTLTTIDTARRLLRSQGIDDAQLAAAAKEQRKAWERAWEAANPHDALTWLGEADLWLLGSVRQLQRQWGGRCVSCVHWQPDAGLPLSGECVRLVDQETDELIAMNESDIAQTAPAFGCVLWAEIAADDVETLRARAELAMAVGLLPRMPEEG